MTQITEGISHRLATSRFIQASKHVVLDDITLLRAWTPEAARELGERTLDIVAALGAVGQTIASLPFVKEILHAAVKPIRVIAGVSAAAAALPFAFPPATQVQAEVRPIQHPSPFLSVRTLDTKSTSGIDASQNITYTAQFVTPGKKNSNIMMDSEGNQAKVGDQAIVWPTVKMGDAHIQLNPKLVSSWTVTTQGDGNSDVLITFGNLSNLVLQCKPGQKPYWEYIPPQTSWGSFECSNAVPNHILEKIGLMGCGSLTAAFLLWFANEKRKARRMQIPTGSNSSSNGTGLPAWLEPHRSRTVDDQLDVPTMFPHSSSSPIPEPKMKNLILLDQMQNHTEKTLRHAKAHGITSVEEDKLEAHLGEIKKAKKKIYHDAG